MPYRIEFAPAVEAHLQFFTAREQAIVLDAIDQKLIHQPHVVTRNCKPLRPNSVAPWELRVGNLRVYFDCQDSPDPKVVVIAIGRKLRSRVMIGGVEVSL